MKGDGTVTTPADVRVDRAAILCDVLRELGYRQFGPNGDSAVFAHRDLPVVIVPKDPALLTADRLRAILMRIDMSDGEWQEICAHAQFS